MCSVASQLPRAPSDTYLVACVIYGRSACEYWEVNCDRIQIGKLKGELVQKTNSRK